MNTLKSNAVHTLFATTLLVAAVAWLSGCDQVVSSANAASVAAPVSSEALYFGDEYATEQRALVADAKSPAPTF
jgi:hypothetical protein